MHVDLRYRNALRRGADDVNWTMICYFQSPWQLIKGRYFTKTRFFGRDFRFANRNVKETKLFKKTVLRTEAMTLIQNIIKQ